MAVEPSWFTGVNLVQAANLALIALVGFFAQRTLSKIDKNQTLLFEKHDKLSKDFYTLRGEHNSNHSLKHGE